MSELKVRWSDLKTFVDARNLSIQWIETSSAYYLKAVDSLYILSAVVKKDGGADVTAFEATYKAAGNHTFTDSDNTALYRLKMSPEGWHYQAHGITFTTATLNSLLNNDETGTDIGDASLTFLDASQIALTTQATIDTSCVATCLDFEPAYDYSIVGGQMFAPSGLTIDLRVHVIAVPDLPSAYGGSKIMVENVNLKNFAGSSLIIDGRTAKRLNYDATLHTNKMRVIINHAILDKKEIHIVWELYKP